jgi:hypothetical protein
MKRSAQIGLLVMGALGTTTAAGYLATNRDHACQASAQSNPQATPGQECRRSIWSGGGHGSGWSRPIFGGSSSSPGVASSHASPGTSASRGGFGGHGGHGGGSSGG